MSSQSQSSVGARPLPPPPATNHAEPVTDTLKQLGANLYDLWLPETRSLPRFLVPGETIEGVVYGRYKQQFGKPPGRGALVATSRRLMLIDHKPLFLNASEISYEVVSGVAHGRAGFAGTVTLSTRMGELSVRTFNRRAADSFVRAMEAHLFNRPAEFRPLSKHPSPDANRL